MAFQQSDLDAIEAAIGSGAKEVWYGNKKVVYHSLTEMIQARDLIKAELAGTPALNKRKQMAVFNGRKYY